MGKGMGDSSVDRHRGADTDAADHIAHLADDMIRQQTPAIIRQESEDDTVDRHNRPGPYQQLQPGKPAGEGIDGHLGGEGAEEDAAGNRSFRVGVGQPAVKRRDGGVEGEAQKNQGRGDAAIKVIEHYRAGIPDMPQDTGHQDAAAKGVHYEIAETGPPGRRRPPRPDENERGNGHYFPEDEQSKQVAGKDHAQRRADIEQCRYLLQGVFQVKAVDTAQEPHDDENIAEGEA